MRRSLAKNVDEGRAFLAGQMPAFVTVAGEPKLREVPVFTFHDVDPARFERQLDHLVSNGYRTIDADELAEGGSVERRVALTFDDATWTFWAYAFPLLERYGCRAILFVVPGVVPEATGARPNLEDVWSGRSRPEEIAESGRREAFCTWPELVGMHESGIVDVQSHSLSHARVPVSPEVVDFVHPGFPAGPGGFEIPLSTLNGSWPGARTPRPGAPVFSSSPRLAGHRRFREDPALVEELVSLVETTGGEGFFHRPDWRRRLRRVVDGHAPAERGAFESDAERSEAIRGELAESRRRLEERLPGSTVRHLAYPWYAGSALADRLAAEAGYRSVLYGSHLAGPGGDGPLPRIRRLPERYVLRLPGRGRVSLLASLKSSRRRFGP